MLSSTIIGVVTGLIFTFLILSVICSALGECIATKCRWRSDMLRETIRGMLHKTKLFDDFYDHPHIVAKLESRPSEKSKNPVVNLLRRLLNLELSRWPSYIDGAQFASVVVDLIVYKRSQRDNHSIADLQDSIEKIDDPIACDALRPLLAAAAETVRTAPPDVLVTPVGAFRVELQKWYERKMKRLTGQYKRRIQKAIFIVAVPIVLLMNIDAVTIAKALAVDENMRKTIVALAQEKTQAQADDEAGESPRTVDPEVRESARDLLRLQAAGIPVGWNAAAIPADMTFGQTCAWLLLKLCGLAVTMVAVSFGAPFWFEMLNKVSNMRSAGAKPPELTDQSDDKTKTAKATTAAAQTVENVAATDAKLLPAAPPSSAIDPNVTAFSLHTARGLAAFSRLAYPAGDDEKADISIWTTNVKAAARTRGFDKCEIFAKGETQGFVAADDANLVVAFRGTEPDKIGDWYTDARFKQTDGPFNSKVHSGFSEALDAVSADLKKIMTDFGNSNRALWITGHSLGAALAALYAARLIEDDGRAIHGVYTFGSPRVGDVVFAEKYDAALRDRTFRFVNDKDLVPRVPPRRLKIKRLKVDVRYEHVGAAMFFDSRGALARDPAAWFRWLGVALDVLDDQEKIAENLKAQAKELFSDHSMDLYEKLLLAARSVT